MRTNTSGSLPRASRSPLVMAVAPEISSRSPCCGERLSVEHLKRDAQIPPMLVFQVNSGHRLHSAHCPCGKKFELTVAETTALAEITVAEITAARNDE